VEGLEHSFQTLLGEASQAASGNSRVGYLTAVRKSKEASAVADLLGGAHGALFRADADQLSCTCLLRLDDMAAAARAACSSLRAARASGNRYMFVKTLVTCGDVAKEAASEMVDAERESREQERLSGHPVWHIGVDLSQEGRISLPTTPAGLYRLDLAFYEAAVATCDRRLAAAGGRGRPAADEDVPDLRVGAIARGSLAVCLLTLGEEGERGFRLTRQAVSNWRRSVSAQAPGPGKQHAQMGLGNELAILAKWLQGTGSDGVAEGDACLHEALKLSESSGDVWLTVKILRYLVNRCGEAHTEMEPAEAEAFRQRLNKLLVQMGRSPETSCSICFEPLAPPADSTAQDAAGGGGSGKASGPSAACVRVLLCDHQFHRGCLVSWKRTASKYACPLCRK